MPRHMKKGRRTRKPRARRARKMVTVNRALQPISQRYICKMKYSESFTATALAPYIRLNLNSIHDPNRTGVGHQPYGHDTFQTLYNRYRVIGCSWVIRAYNPTYALRFGALPANEEITTTSMSELVENPRAKFRFCVPQGIGQSLKGKVYLPSLVGRTKAQYMADDRYQAQFGSSPNELAILNIFAADLNDALRDGTVFAVELTYTVEVFDVKNLSQS